MKNPNQTSQVQHSTQGEAFATWGLWSLLLVTMFVTYTRLDPAELYHVTGDGITGGLSRILVAVNFPIAIIAIALVLVAIDALPPRAWWIGAPAIVLCAVTAVPGVVDDQDLDARWINLVPAIGVALAAGLSVVAARQPGRRSGFTARLPLDRCVGGSPPWRRCCRCPGSWPNSACTAPDGCSSWSARSPGRTAPSTRPSTSAITTASTEPCSS